MFTKIMVESRIELDAVTESVLDTNERLHKAGLNGFDMSVTSSRVPHGDGDVKITCTTVAITGGPTLTEINNSAAAADAITLLWANIGRITAGTSFYVDSIHREPLIRRAAIEARLNGYVRTNSDALDVVASFSDGPGLAGSQAARLHTGSDYANEPHEIDRHDAKVAIDDIKSDGCRELRRVWLAPHDAVRVAALAIEWTIKRHNGQ